MHSRREDAFKEGLGGIQDELMRTRKHAMCFIITYQPPDAHGHPGGVGVVFIKDSGQLESRSVSVTMRPIG